MESRTKRTAGTTAQLARNAESAGYVLTCLVGAIGIDINGRLFGIQGSPGGLIPFTIPELALYKNTLRKGFAKTEIFLVDLETDEIIHHSGPVEGATYTSLRTLSNATFGLSSRWWSGWPPP